MAAEIGSPPHFFQMLRFQHQAPQQLFYKKGPDFAQQQAMQQLTFGGKQMRKAVNQKTGDYNPSVIKYLEVSPVNVLLDQTGFLKRRKFLEFKVISITAFLELVG